MQQLPPIGDAASYGGTHSPKSWVRRLAKNGKGSKYCNPKKNGDYIRFMQANLDPRAPLGQKVPYFVRVKDGNKYLTKTGKWIIFNKSIDPVIYHIPQKMFYDLLPYMKFT